MRLKGTHLIARWVAALFLLAAPRLGLAAEFKLNKAIGVGGVTAEEVDSFTELVRLTILQNGEHALSDKAAVEVQPRIIKIGSGYLVAVEKLEKGKVVFTDSVRISGDEEWDLAARRLARSVVDGKKSMPDDRDDRIQEMTAHEANLSQQRVSSRNRLVLGFGPFFSHGLGASGEVLFDWYVGLNFEIQQFVPRLFLTGATGIGQSRIQSFNIGLGFAYYLSNSASSPYVGVDLGYGSVRKTTDEKFNGFSIAPFFGYAVLRNANVVLTVQGVWRPILTNINGGFGGVYGLETGLQF